VSPWTADALRPTLLVSCALALVAACAPRAEVDRAPAAEHAHSALLEPPFTLSVSARADRLDVHLDARRALAGEVELEAVGLWPATGQLKRVAARSGTTALARPVGPWRVTARWVDPTGVAGATAVVDAVQAPDPAPRFEPIVPVWSGALRIDESIVVRTP